MKNIIFVLGLIVLFAGKTWGQCTPQAPTGNPGFTPDYNNIPCIEQGNFYSEVFLLENVDTLYFGNIKFFLDYLVLDSITNLPCGIEWIANSGDNTWDTGETGCIRISGTTNEPVGQYKLGIYIHASVPALGTILTGELADIVDQLENLVGGSLGIDYRYYLRVVAPGSSGSCPNVVTNNTSLNLTANATCTPGVNDFRVDIAEPTKRICEGDSVELDLQISNGANPVIVWDNAGTLTDDASATTTAFPDTITYYTISVTDSNGSGNTIYVRYTVDVEDELPDASFSTQQNGYVVAFTPSTPVAMSYTWDFGDGSTINTKLPIHTYTENGTYTVTLTIENVCGTDTKTQEVVVNVVGIEELNAEKSGISVFPNPTNDKFVIGFDKHIEGLVVVELMDMQGRKVLQQSSLLADNLTVDVSNMQPGMYILRLTTEGEVAATQRLLITP